MTFAIGSLVKARGREWVVLPESEDDFLVLRPLGGADVEVAGIHTALEQVESASFPPPDPADWGDHASARLLHEALRLSVRSSAGPFRSFGRIAVEPRPYQLVPLMMALRLDPIRLLIADDVGIGKTVEAALIARELLDRGEIKGLSVLCPPHLAEQWRDELLDKFHIEAELVLASTAGRLERDLPAGVNLFDRHPVTIVSMDYIKQERRREMYLRSAPELVIVDEAHSCADAAAKFGGRHQRNQLVRGLAKNPDRHLILVTATPHSGSNAAFSELTGFLRDDFRTIPEDISKEEQRTNREQLARYFIQRRRKDIRAYLDAATPFPERRSSEATYKLSPEYRTFFQDVFSYARRTLKGPAAGGARQQRVLWWSVVALLQAIGSSPAAAVSTLTTRAVVADATSADEVDAIGEARVYDTDEESAEGLDVVAGADPGEAPEPSARSARRQLLDLAAAAKGLSGAKDAKLAEGVTTVRDLLSRGRTPIVFCRFIATAEYVRDALRKELPADVFVVAVTGSLPPDAREQEISVLGKKHAAGDKVVLVATDCLSEGINLQETFDAVLHYDLSWNPTRHEQRAGRVDRFLQPKKDVEVITLYGENNPIDGHVLEVLLRKHQTIIDTLGISVPVPVDTAKVLTAILERLVMSDIADDTAIEQLTFFEELTKPVRDDLHSKWDEAARREDRTKSWFAHGDLKPDEVAAELQAAREAVGRGVDVRHFVTDVIERHKGKVVARGDLVDLNVAETPRALRDAAGLPDSILTARFEPPRTGSEAVLTRTHPAVEALAGWVVDTALDPDTYADRVTNRCGAIRTAGVARRTTALLARARYDIRAGTADQLLAEEVRVLAFEGDPATPEWLDEESAVALLDLEPTGPVLAQQATEALGAVIAALPELETRFQEEAAAWASKLAASHDRVRPPGARHGKTRVSPHLPLDILGVFHFLPGPKAS